MFKLVRLTKSVIGLRCKSKLTIRSSTTYPDNYSKKFQKHISEKRLTEYKIRSTELVIFQAIKQTQTQGESLVKY